MPKDFWKEHKVTAEIMCIDCTVKLCTEWVCSEDHRGHSFKPLKTMFNEALSKTIDAKENLTAYEERIEESNDSLKEVKTLNEDITSTAVSSITEKVKKFLNSQSNRIKDSLKFIDSKVDEAKTEK